jgi:hypothetical protein
MAIPRRILLTRRMRNDSDNSCIRNQNTHFALNKFISENPTVYDIVWNMVEADRPQMTIWRMRFSCWMNKARNTYSEYVTLIAFQRQRWLYERTSMLRYTYSTLLIMLSYCYWHYRIPSGHCSLSLSPSISLVTKKFVNEFLNQTFQ